MNISSLFSLGALLGLDERYAPWFDKLLLPVCALLVLLSLALKSLQLFTLVKSKLPRNGILPLDIVVQPDAQLSSEHLRRIAVGNLYAYRMSASLNTLSTHLSEKRLNHIVETAWDIHSRESALRVLHELSRAPSEPGFALVAKVFVLPPAQRAAALKSYADSLTQEAACKEGLVQLEKHFEELCEGGMCEKPADLLRMNLCGWDAGRLSFLSRCVYDKGYIDEEECHHFLEAAYLQAHAAQRSWESLAYSYVLGRVLWCGDTEPLVFARNLLNDHRSPWTYIPW